jgi:hypothetical protein
MRHTIHRTREGYPYCAAQYRDECLLIRFARLALTQAAAPTLIHSPATLPAPARPVN